MDQPIIPFDLHRMILGEDPPLYYLEIVVRCAVIYVWTIALLRWIGGRSVTQLSLVEFLLVIALGSAVGDALFYPDVPLAQAMVVILVVVLINKAIDGAILRWDLVKRIVDGGPVEMVRDGRIVVRSITHRTMGHAELVSALRSAGIRNLGEVDRVYMEANGRLSVFRRDTPRAGLAIAPPPEVDVAGRPAPVAAGAPAACCGNCGLVLSRSDANRADVRLGPCPECGQDRWVTPVAPGDDPALSAQPAATKR